MARAAWLWPGRCWAGFDPAATTGQEDVRVVWSCPARGSAGFRRAAMVRRIGAAVNVAAPLSAASAAVAGVFVACLWRRIGSGVHARGAVEAEFAIDFSLLSDIRSRSAAHHRSLPELRGIALGARSADPGGPVASPVHLPRGPCAPARLTGVSAEDAFRVPSAPARCACPGGLSSRAGLAVCALRGSIGSPRELPVPSAEWCPGRGRASRVHPDGAGAG
jgi:hypothetical protein